MGLSVAALPPAVPVISITLLIAVRTMPPPIGRRGSEMRPSAGSVLSTVSIRSS
jgi:hypothetical protein